jgi:nondiscriminating glutamyl-tRNA synthetase
MPTHIETENPVRVRFAPSPTGFVHIGSLRTALFTYLFARKCRGVNILRVEDTDQARFVLGALDNMLRVFQRLGITFDEGFRINAEGAVESIGNYGPYRQSDRLSLYNEYIHELLEKKAAYYCFCSTERLDQVRKDQAAHKLAPMYDKHCRKLSESEIAEQLASFKAAGKNPVVRLAVPQEGRMEWNDLVYGLIGFDLRVIDDQILLKSDGYPTYHFAVVVDDHLMQISHVTRGEDWISSTPKQLLLYKSFGWNPPIFAHFPNILNQNKKKLSKRQGDVMVDDFLKKGYLPETLINFVALLGWNPKTEQEIFSLTELEQVFDITHVHKAGAVFDTQKLDWLNGAYLRQKTPTELAGLLLPYWQEAELISETTSMDYLAMVAGVEQERLKYLSEIVDRTKYFFKAPQYEASLLVWKKSTPEETVARLEGIVDALKLLPSDAQADYVSAATLEQVIRKVMEKHGWDNGSTLWPMRVALTGLSASPGPFEVASVLTKQGGLQVIITRLEAAIEKLNS